LISAAALPQARQRSSQRSPRHPSWILGVLLLRKRRGTGRRKTEEGKEGVKDEKMGGERRQRKGKGGEIRRGPSQLKFLATPLNNE